MRLLVALLLLSCHPAPITIPCPEPASTQATPVVTQTPTTALTPTKPRPAGVPAAITVDGVPLVSKEIKARLSQYQNVRSAALQSITHEGLLISTRFADTNQLHLVAAPGGRREQLTFFDEPVSSGLYLWKSRQLFFTQSKGGDENTQLYRLDTKNGKAVLLTDGKSRHEIDALSPTDKYLAYANNARNGKDMDLFLLDTESGQSEALFTVKDESWSVLDFTANDQRLLLRKFVSANEDYLYLYDRTTHEKTPIPIPGGGKVSHGPAHFSPDGQGVFLTSNAESEFQRLAYVDVKTLSYTWITDKIPWDINGLAVYMLGRKSPLFAFTANEDGASGLYLGTRSAKGSFSYEKIETPLGVVSGLRWYPEDEILAFTLSRPEAPSDVYTWELKGKKLQRWTYSEVGGLDPKSFITPSLIRYPSFDGREIPAYVFMPKTANTRLPVVINIHGGPESQYQPLFSGLFQYWVSELGLAVISPNVRGSEGYGKTYLALDDIEKREDSVKDIGALLDWISTQPNLDASRVAVYGGSYGGFMVLASLVMYGDKIKAGVDVVGIANFVTFLENTSPYRVDLRRVEYGDERKAEVRAFLEKISPANNTDKLKSALMVVHGKNDPRVPFSEAEQIAAKARAQGKPVWTVYADNEGHGFNRKENRDYLNEATTLFFREFLLK